MHQLLRLIRNRAVSAAEHVEVVVTRPQPERLVLSYIRDRQDGRRRYFHLSQNAARSDELWQHTCFEAFVRGASGSEYYEFNFSPSTQWAAYRFIGYRSGMCVAAEIGTPPIDVAIGSPKPDFAGRAGTWIICRFCHVTRSWRLALSAVIEETNGDKSYWALAHPPGQAGLPSRRRLCLRAFSGRAIHEIRHRSADRRAGAARAARRQARGAARASRFRHAQI